MKLCRGVSPSMRVRGSHSKFSWSRRRSITSSVLADGLVFGVWEMGGGDVQFPRNAAS